MVLVAVGLALGWRPGAGGIAVAVAAVLLATAGFGGLGLFLAGVLRAEVNLAAANGLWLLLLLVSGMVSPLGNLPRWLQDVAKVFPAAALARSLHEKSWDGPGNGPRPGPGWPSSSGPLSPRSWP